MSNLVLFEPAFWSNVDRDGPVPDPAAYGDIGACWQWTGPTMGAYGVVRGAPEGNGPRSADGAHRVSLRLKLGRPLTGWALHSCDNQLCVNPDHLREGTPADNAADRAERSRYRGPLTAEMKDRIVELRTVHGMSQADIARDLGVGITTVNRHLTMECDRDADGKLTHRCPMCAAGVPQPARGYRLYCLTCKPLNDDIERIRKHVAAIKAGTHPACLSLQAIVELRYELFCLVSELPRPRDKAGRYIRSQR